MKFMRQVTLLVLGFASLAVTASHMFADYVDPAGDINSTMGGAAAGASSAYITTLTVLASSLLIGFIIWGLRKGTGPVRF